MKDKKAIICNYIAGYNNFDVATMVSDFADDIVFKNISDGKTTMVLEGLEAFKEQAEEAKNYFSARTQTIRSFTQQNDKAEIEIDYRATVATDLPNGLKKGYELKLTGKSVFEFADGRVIKLFDIS